MSVKIHRVPNPESHTERVVLVDHFGHEHDMTLYPVFLKDKLDDQGKIIPGEYEHVPHDISVDIAQAVKLHELRESLHLAHMIAHHPDHPATLAHPDHPVNKGKLRELPEWPKPKNCKDCK